MASDLLGRFGIKISHSGSNRSVLIAAIDSMVAIGTPPEYTATSRVTIRGQRDMLTCPHRGSPVTSSLLLFVHFKSPAFLRVVTFSTFQSFTAYGGNFITAALGAGKMPTTVWGDVLQSVRHG